MRICRWKPAGICGNVAHALCGRHESEDIEVAIDPVCKMKVDEKKAPGGVSDYKGQKYYFCAPGCKKAFDKEPEKYLAKK